MKKQLANNIVVTSAGAVIIILISSSFYFDITGFDSTAYGEKIAAELKVKENANGSYVFPTVKASIFSPFVVPQPKPEPVKKVELPPPPQVDPYEAVNRDLKTYQMFGFSKDSAGNNTVFLAKGDNILTLKAGDSFDSKYILKEIKATSVIIGIAGDDVFKFEIVVK